MKTPEVMNGYFSSWAKNSVLAKNESEKQKIQEALKTTGVPTAIYYPIPLHLQKAYTYLDYKEGDFPVSERCSKQIFSLPMHPYLTNEEIEMIAKVIVGA